MTQVAIIGAGPYGLSIAAHLKSHNVPFRIFGRPLDTWTNHMPAGMSLKSDGFASCLVDHDGEGTLAAYCAKHGLPYHDTEIPVPLETFCAYAADFQQRFVPNLEDRQVVSVERAGDGFVLELDNAETVQANLVVTAVGITHFARIPAELSGLPESLVTHSYAHHDLSGFAGRDVAVIGAGSSAVDVAVLLGEAGANTSLIARRQTVRFASTVPAGGRSLWQRVQAPSTGIGPGWRSWMCENLPFMFRFVPAGQRENIVRRHLGPSSPGHMKDRFEKSVTTMLGQHIERADEQDGRVRLTLRDDAGKRTEVVTDHVIAATGYWPDLERLRFFGDDLRRSIQTQAGVPVLSSGFESSVKGLYFVGLSSTNAFGPYMRFMVGATYAAPAVARRLARQAKRPDPTRARISA